MDLLKASHHNHLSIVQDSLKPRESDMTRLKMEMNREVFSDMKEFLIVNELLVIDAQKRIVIEKTNSY